jgi:hypothetical protein
LQKFETQPNLSPGSLTVAATPSTDCTQKRIKPQLLDDGRHPRFDQ